jgi:thiosulfate reductase cytochrome b subunit
VTHTTLESSEPPALPADTTPARVAVHRHHWLVRLCHWANAILLVGMIASGLQIYNAYQRFGPRDMQYMVLNPVKLLHGSPAAPEWARLGGWLAGGLSWHFALAWPFVITGLLYLLYLVFSGEWRSLLFRPRDIVPAAQMQLYYLRLRKEHPLQGKHNALQKAAYTSILVVGALAVLTGFAIYKPVQLSWLTALFGGYELTRYWHFVSVWVFVAFTILHVILVFVVDPASLRGDDYRVVRGRFPSHD